MALKKKSTFVKQECEYESPDGEIYDIAFIKHGDRTYVQWSVRTKDTEKPAEISVDSEKNEQVILPHTIIDGKMLEEMFELYNDIMGRKTLANQPTLRKPNIIDHRGVVTSFNKPVHENEQDPNWQNDVEERKNMPRPSYQKSGSSGLKFKRVGAKDLI